MAVPAEDASRHRQVSRASEFVHRAVHTFASAEPDSGRLSQFAGEDCRQQFEWPNSYIVWQRDGDEIRELSRRDAAALVVAAEGRAAVSVAICRIASG